jgi:fatty acid desaturase
VIEGGLTKDEIRELGRINHARVIAELAAFWLALIGLVQLSIWMGLGWSTPLIILLVGCLQNGLILWTHEGAHVNLHRDKATNDFWADLMICGPIGVYLDAYRWHHGRHHRYLGDPNEEIELSAYFCIHGGDLWRHIARHVTGYVAYTVLFRRQRNTGEQTRFDPPPPRSKPAWAGFLVFNASLFLLCALQGAWWMYAVWAFPLGTLAPMISNFRTIVEHQPSSDVCDTEMDTAVPPITRVLEANWLERVLFAPVGFHYHYEHHLYPGLPYASLSKARKILNERGHFGDDTVRARGYIATVWKLASRRDYGVRFGTSKGVSEPAQGQ